MHYNFEMLRLLFTLLPLTILVSCNNPSSVKQSGNKNPDYLVQDIEIAPIKDIPISKSDELLLENSSKQVMTALASSDINLLAKYSFDTINCQACQSFPKGTNVEDIPVRYMPVKNLLIFYRDSFLFPKALKNINNIKYETSMLALGISAFDKKRPHSYTFLNEDTITVYKVQYANRETGPEKWSLGFYFVKMKNSFKFFGLYL